MINVIFFLSGAEEEDTEGWVVSSESCSFQSIGATSVFTFSNIFCNDGDESVVVNNNFHVLPGFSGITERFYQERLFKFPSME